MDDLTKEFKQLNGKTVIVEGIKDKKALKEFGVTNVITLNKSIFEIIDNADYDEVVILTDLDKHGRKLYSILKEGFERKGVRVDNRLRVKLFENQVCTIESLSKRLNS